jgi:signal transduction histidine kinase/predicted RNA-binding protein with RPS1 domain
LAGSNSRVGEIVTGTVRQVLPFGVFVELAGGLTGYIRRREMTLSANVDPRTVVTVGQTIRALIIEPAEPARNIELSLRRLESDPWPAFADEHKVGDVIPVTIKHVFADGVLVEHTPGVDGYIPGDELGAPTDALWVGDHTEAAIIHLDKSRTRLLLSVRRWAARLAVTDVVVERLAGEGHHLDTEPLVIAPPAGPSVPADLAGPILVVEDQDDVRVSLLEMLRDAGYDAVGVPSAEEALALCARRRFALALIDLDMPTVNGLQLVARLTENGHALPIAVMSVPDLLAQEYEQLRALGVGLAYSKLDMDELFADLHRLARGERLSLPPLAAAELPDEAERFRALAGSLRAEHRVAERLSAALTELRDSLQADLAVIFRFDPAARAVSVVAQCGAPLLRADDLYHLPESPVRDVIQEDEVLLRRRVSGDRSGRFRNLLAVVEFESCVGIPLEAAGAVEHALFLFSRRPDIFGSQRLREALAVAVLLQSVLEAQALDERIVSAGQLLLTGELTSAISHEVANKGVTLDQQVRNARRQLARVAAGGALDSLADTLARMAETVDGLRETSASIISLKTADGGTTTPIGNALNRAKRQVSLEAQRKKLHVRVTAGEDLPPAAASPNRLHFVFLNLMINAIQWARGTDEHRGYLRVDASALTIDGAPWLRIRFSDNGPGIHRDNWEKVFAMGMTTREGGSGLGLYIARAVLEAMNGRIYVQESLMQLGTTFAVELPAARVP